MMLFGEGTQQGRQVLLGLLSIRRLQTKKKNSLLCLDCSRGSRIRHNKLRQRLDMDISQTFRWVPSVLSPNSRAHYRTKAAAFRTYKNYALRQAKAAWDGMKPVRVPHPLFDDGRVHISVRFYPPAKWHFDEDNMIARFKAGIDGIRDALDVDDRFFHFDFDWGDHTVEDGSILVTISME